MFPISKNFYVVSDTHFFHDNIVKYCNRMEHTGGRHHHAYMIDKWNSVVGKDDVVLHLGDVLHWRGDGFTRYAKDIEPRLNGIIYMLRGNHDKASESDYRRIGLNIVEPFQMDHKGWTVEFNHYPWAPGEFREKHLRIHGHIHNNGYPKTARWQDGSEPTQPNQINVSVEVIDYTPQRIDTLLDRYLAN